MITVGGLALTAVVDPRRGAKILSLRDADGVEWLAQAEPSADGLRGKAFVDAEMAGWDECAPTIVACRVGDHDLPDHGDLWDIPFDVETDGTTVTAVGSSLGYRLRRGIRATETGLRLEYEVTALRGVLPFLWAAHPQFIAPPGTRVELDGGGTGVMRVVDVMDPALPELIWSEDLASIDTVPPSGYRKLYAHPEQPVHGARLVRADGSTLALSWSPECPYVGLWFDRAAFSREPVIAIEPATAYFDALDTAIRLNRVPFVSPRRPLRWWVEVTAQPVARPPQPSAR
ncbi:hypothetical protein [Agromyces sp. NPDC056965]|uniref:hypothetical protein n=1 Tax=Agromyces sp. NPDC056965 TaxID=3345983 RepID=UPI00362EC306